MFYPSNPNMSHYLIIYLKISTTSPLHLPRRYTGLRDNLLTLLLMRSYRLGIQNALLMTYIYGTTLIRRFVLMRQRNGTGMFVFVDSFGDLNLLNAPRSTLCIKRKVGGYCFCKESLFILPRFEICGLPQSLFYPPVYTLNRDTLYHNNE